MILLVLLHHVLVLDDVVADTQQLHELPRCIGGFLLVLPLPLLRQILEDRLQLIRRRIGLRLAVEDPPLFPRHGLVIDVSRIIHVVRLGEALLNRVLGQHPVPDHLLLLVAQRDIRAHDVDTVLALLSRGIGLRPERHEEAQILVSFDVKEDL